MVLLWNLLRTARLWDHNGSALEPHQNCSALATHRLCSGTSSDLHGSGITHRLSTGTSSDLHDSGTSAPHWNLILVLYHLLIDDEHSQLYDSWRTHSSCFISPYNRKEAELLRLFTGLNPVGKAHLPPGRHIFHLSIYRFTDRMEASLRGSSPGSTW
jgi:hypothetical protein